MKQLKKNSVIELEITSVGSQGEGIGRHDGMAVFVPAAAVGDVIRAKLLKIKKNLAYAKIEEIIQPSKDRVQNDCPAFPQCGGCTFRHISYAAEGEIKRQRVYDAMKRIGGVDIAPERYLAAAQPARYRNKAMLPCQADKNGKPAFGFYASNSHRLVGTSDCLLQPAGFARVASAVSDYMLANSVKPYNELTCSGDVRHLYLRASRESGEIMVCLVVNCDSLPDEAGLAEAVRKAEPAVSSVLLNINTQNTNVVLGGQCRLLWGDGCITDSILGVCFRISPLSFFQVNPAQTERLYSIAAEYADLSDEATLLDMYCGTGTIGLTMAGKVKKLIGVEIVPEAIEDARVNAALNETDNAEFVCSDAFLSAEKLKSKGEKIHTVILDPPRKGCDERLLSTIAGMEPSRIVYVSCDPATLARDAARLMALGYAVERYSIVDMFPRTIHVETVCLFSKESNLKS